jgi:hypothetical protein
MSPDDVRYLRRRYKLISEALSRLPRSPDELFPPMDARRMLLSVRRDWMDAYRSVYGHTYPANTDPISDPIDGWTAIDLKKS